MAILRKYDCIRCFVMLAASAMLISCVKRPEGVLSDKDMASLMADIKLAEAYSNSLPPVESRESKEALLEYVIEKHGLTRAEYDSTMLWYGRNMDAYYEMCELAEKQLTAKKAKVAGSSSVENAASDLWPYPRQVMISQLSGSNAFDFSVPTADVEKGERINLRFRLNNSTDGTALLGVEYEGGDMAYVSRSVRDSKRIDMTFQTDTARTVTRVFGNMLVSDRSRLPLWVDSVRLAVLPFDSVEYFNIYSQRRYVEPRQRRRPAVVQHPDSAKQDINNTPDGRK